MGTLTESNTCEKTSNLSDSSEQSATNESCLSKSEGKVFPIFQKKFKPRSNPLKNLEHAIHRSTPPRKRKSLLGKRETPGLTQMVLDAGQKKIGPVMCNECGLLYTPGEIEDEEEHRKAHSRLENLHTVQLWKNPNLVTTCVDGAYIVMVKNSSANKPALRKLRHFMEWIESELGIVTGADSSVLEQFFFYVFPAKRKNFVRILGFASVEVINKGSIVGRCISDENADWKPNVPVHIGISRIWVDKDFRRRKIATKMIEAARFNSGIPGHVVLKENLGMYEPNGEGTAFMGAYTESKGWAYTYA